MTTANAKRGFIRATLRLPASRGGRQLRTSFSQHTIAGPRNEVPEERGFSVTCPLRIEALRLAPTSAACHPALTSLTAFRQAVADPDAITAYGSGILPVWTELACSGWMIGARKLLGSRPGRSLRVCRSGIDEGPSALLIRDTVRRHLHQVSHLVNLPASDQHLRQLALNH